MLWKNQFLDGINEIKSTICDFVFLLSFRYSVQAIVDNKVARWKIFK